MTPAIQAVRILGVELLNGCGLTAQAHHAPGAERLGLPGELHFGLALEDFDLGRFGIEAIEARFRQGDNALLADHGYAGILRDLIGLYHRGARKQLEARIHQTVGDHAQRGVFAHARITPGVSSTSARPSAVRTIEFSFTSVKCTPEKSTGA